MFGFSSDDAGTRARVGRDDARARPPARVKARGGSTHNRAFFSTTGEAASVRAVDHERWRDLKCAASAHRRARRVEPHEHTVARTRRRRRARIELSPSRPAPPRRTTGVRAPKPLPRGLPSDPPKARFRASRWTSRSARRSSRRAAGAAGSPRPLRGRRSTPGVPPTRRPRHPLGRVRLGPSPESQHESRERLARERQLEYNEYLAAQQEREAHAHALGAGPNNDPHAHGRPGPVTEDTTSPGLVFDEEQRPRPKGGLRDIHNSDQKRRNREHERKRQYAAELQQQMAEQARRKQLERQKSRARDLQAVGMGNVIQDMHDGRLDGVDENGVPLGYDYARVHRTDQDAFDVAEKTPAPRFSAGAQNAAARENRERGRGPPGAMRGARGSDGSEDQDRAAAAASRRRKAEYQRELEAQMADNAARKARARREEEERDARDDRAAAKYDPWGKAGGGAPRATRRAPSRRISARCATISTTVSTTPPPPPRTAAGNSSGNSTRRTGTPRTRVSAALTTSPGTIRDVGTGARIRRRARAGISASARTRTLARSRRRTARAMNSSARSRNRLRRNGGVRRRRNAARRRRS